MTEVSLAQMLAAREQRVAKQQALLKKHGTPLVCFTLNIAGPVKTSPLIERLFRFGLDRLLSQLPTPLDISVSKENTGCEAILAVSASAKTLKSVCTTIEEETAVGRLFDIDVLDENGIKLQRTSERCCLVCGAPGKSCAARRLHSVEELQEITNKIITNHFQKHDAQTIATMAVDSLLDEVYTTPKPGLVDLRNNGSHRDMDVPLFEKSAKTLHNYFETCVNIGITTADQPSKECFSTLRQAGICAENTMFSATNGVNTHKGAIYSFGVWCGAIGRLWKPETPIAPINTLSQECRRLVNAAVAEDFATATPRTAGLRFYHSAQITGIRGEAAAGFPLAIRGLELFKKAKIDRLSDNDAGVATLLFLIAHTQDTALLNRGGIDGAAYAANVAAQLTKSNTYPSPRDVETLDDDFIRRNLSPGGAADLLALTYFLHKLETYKTSITAR